ncbi:MAG: glycosyltransferase family 9 protein [Ignavibacterium sp.]|nr:MAG: glycosyltransferase family 9 protein [Ignavibacterium sp.]
MDAQKVEALNNESKILVIQTAFLGDAILTLPMLKKLRDRNPEAQIDVLAIPSTTEIFSAASYVDNVIVMDKRGKQKGIRALNKFVKELKANSYTKVFSPHRSFRSAYIMIRLSGDESYGFDNSSFRYAFKNLVKYEQKYHEVQRNISLIGENVDADSWKIKPEISIDEAIENNVDNFISNNNLNSGFISIAPGSVWETKRYPKVNYIELIKLLTNKNETVVVIGSDDDSILCNEIASNFSSNVLSVAGKFSVTGTICLLKYSKLLITNDSAPTHMGMCADIPVLTIYCSTVSDFGFYPYNDKSQFVSYNELDCKPCGIHGYDECPVKTYDCGYKLLPAEIFAITEQMIKTNG